MRILSQTFTVTLLASLATGCLEQEFGYKENPAYTLLQSHSAVIQNDLAALERTLGKKALCVWATPEGVTKLRANLPRRKEKLTIEVKELSNSALSQPRFMGYWSYHRANYQVDVLHKLSRELILRAVSECNFGEDGAQTGARSNWRDYPVKGCRTIAVETHGFEEPAPTRDCSLFEFTPI
jgi:hypothetical protein